MLLYKTLAFTIYGKSHTKIINLKYQLQHKIKNFNYLMYHILYQIFKIILHISLKSMEERLVVCQPSIRIYINKIENRIMFKINTEYYHKLLMPEMMKLLESNKSQITRDEHGENVPHLEIIEVILVHCNVVNNDYQQDSGSLNTFLPNKYLVLNIFYF